MLLRRSLPPLPTSGVTTNRHRVGLSVVWNGGISSASPKPTKPIELNPILISKISPK